MLVLLLEAGILVALIKIFTDDDIGFWKPLIIAFLTAIGTAVAAAFFLVLLGLWGILVGVVLSALLLALCLTGLFGIDFKNSAIIGGVFVFVHVGIQVGLYMALGA
ncbi:MAG: hypothetical protein JWN70_5033 [Planctomycetaceae bacterium]|nr:hypothetical protein [Planctomycetaceae bacterium]